MRNKVRFWMNVALIAGAHVAIIVGLIHWSRAEKDSSAQNIVWMNGGGGDGVALATKKSPAPRRNSKTEAMKDQEVDEDRPILASAPSEIQLPTPTASPVRTPVARFTPTPKPSASPKTKGTPKPKPKPTAKPTPKPVSVSTPPPESRNEEDEDNVEPILATGKSEIQLPVATPKPSPSRLPNPPSSATPTCTRTSSSGAGR